MKKKKIILLILFLILVFPLLNVSAISAKVSCGIGEGMITDIPKKIPELTSFAIDLVQVAVPVLLIVMGTIDLFKGITSSKDDEIKKGQQIFIKRLIIGALIFFIAVIVKFVISIIADSNKTNIIDCIDCFISNSCNQQANDPNKIKDSATGSSSSNKNTNKTNSSNKNSSSSSSGKNNNKNSSSSSSSKNNNKSSSSSSSSKSTTTKKISNNLYVGDSRTVGMCEGYKLCENHPYIAKGSMGYDWFVDTAIPQINNKIKSKNYNIVILMGVNGAGTDGKALANQYYNKVSELSKTTWKKQNVFFVSINPVVDGMSYTYTSGVNSFNKQMKSKISSSKISNLKYCDTNSKLKMSEIDSGDGLHYNKTGYQKIYNIIKSDCLKQK